MNYEIIRYDEKYNEQIYDIEKEIWSPDLNVNKSYLQWKYFDNPYSGSPKLYLVLCSGKLVAFRGMYPTEWQLGDRSESFIALCAGDLIIKQSLRNKGVYRALMSFMIKDLTDSGYLYLLNFSANPVNLIGSLAMGWKSIGRIRIMRQELYPISMIYRLLRKNVISKLLRGTKVTKLLRKTTRPIKITDRDFNNSKKLPPQIKVEKTAKPHEMASLVKKLIPKNKIMLSRNEKFFSWRYKNPLSDYLFLYWSDNGLKGYLVAQTGLYKYDYMINFNVIELEAVNYKIKEELLKALLSILGFRSITIWSNMLDKNNQKFLISKGFKEASSAKSVVDYTSTALIYTTSEPGNKIEFRGSNLLDMNNWDLKMIYSDDF